MRKLTYQLAVLINLLLVPMGLMSWFVLVAEWDEPTLFSLGTVFLLIAPAGPILAVVALLWKPWQD